MFTFTYIWNYEVPPVPPIPVWCHFILFILFSSFPWKWETWFPLSLIHMYLMFNSPYVTNLPLLMLAPLPCSCPLHPTWFLTLYTGSLSWAGAPLTSCRCQPMPGCTPTGTPRNGSNMHSLAPSSLFLHPVWTLSPTWLGSNSCQTHLMTFGLNYSGWGRARIIF